MREEDIYLLLRQQPSPLLRLHVTGGLVFEVTDPDLTVINRSTVQILLPDQEGRQRQAVINLLHVVWVEVVSPPD